MSIYLKTKSPEVSAKYYFLQKIWFILNKLCRKPEVDDNSLLQHFGYSMKISWFSEDTFLCERFLCEITTIAKYSTFSRLQISMTNSVFLALVHFSMPLSFPLLIRRVFFFAWENEKLCESVFFSRKIKMGNCFIFDHCTTVSRDSRVSGLIFFCHRLPGESINLYCVRIFGGLVLLKNLRGWGSSRRARAQR